MDRVGEQTMKNDESVLSEAKKDLSRNLFISPCNRTIEKDGTKEK